MGKTENYLQENLLNEVIRFPHLFHFFFLDDNIFVRHVDSRYFDYRRAVLFLCVHIYVERDAEIRAREGEAGIERAGHTAKAREERRI